MKFILLCMAGAADQPTELLGGKTPLEVAKVPNMHHFSKIGRFGTVKLHPDRHEVSADACFVNLLGYNADKNYTGRGPLEAADMGLDLEENEIPFRMNFITESGGKLADPRGGGVTTKEAKALINFLNKKVSSGFVRFFAGTEYRHIAVIKDSHGYDALAARTIPPENIIGERIEDNLPKGPGEELLKKLMYDAKLLLQDHEINQVRVDLKENPANMIWLWGQGRRPQFDRFSDRHGISGAFVSNVAYARGLAHLAGLTIAEVPGLTGHYETDLEKKAKTVIDLLKDKDFVCCYLDECDEASRRGDLKEKIAALEATDYFLFSWIRDYLEENKDTRVLLTSGVITSTKTKRPVREPVPFAVAGAGIMPDEGARFTELAARSSEYKVAGGRELMETFLNQGA